MPLLRKIAPWNCGNCKHGNGDQCTRPCTRENTRPWNWDVRWYTDPLISTSPDKVVLICGSSSGIGEEIAYNLATLGAKLILVSRTASRLEVIKQNALEKGSPGVEIIPFDLSDTSSSQDLVTKAVALFGGIDHVILNHAAFPMGRFLDIEQHQDPRYIEKVNLK